MSNKYLTESMEYLKNTYHIDPLTDIILSRSDKIFGYVNIQDIHHPVFHIMAGNLSRIDLEDKPKITLNDFIDYLDLDNGYAMVSGKQEYKTLIRESVFDFTKKSDLTFPIRYKDHRHWIHVVIIPPSQHPDICPMQITDVTDNLLSDEQLFIKSHLDSLTQLFNKYTLDYHYGLRYQFDHFHAMYLDLDNFKELNDAVGHRQANNYLRAFANILRSKQHNHNLFYRIGGDEFVGLIFLPTKEVETMAASIVKETRKLRSISDFPISVSIGIISANMREDVIGKADKVMYKAKKSGKDKYILEHEFAY